MLDHHQGVARIAQAQHGFVDAVHVTRVQADAGLVQHKQGVDQRRAQSCGEVDALHFTAAQGAALSIEREVPNAHIAEVFQTRANFVHQQMQGLRVCARCIDLRAVEELLQLVDGQEHQVMQAQAGHGFELRACPLNALRHEAFGRRQHGIGMLFGADAPQQAVGLQTRARTRATRRVASVLGQQHPNVHLVGLAL